MSAPVAEASLRYPVAELISAAERKLLAAGMDVDKAKLVAEILVEGDLLGHDTHGLAQLPGYVRALENGSMTGSGEPIVLQDRGAASLWDGRWLSGVWLTATAVDTAVARASTFGIAAISIRQAHHNACLQAYLQRATDHGLMVIIAASDPSNASVAPFLGLDRVLGPDPIAIGIPTDGDPILIDTSSSITTNGMVARLAKSGGKLPGAWVQDHEGQLTDDPAVVGATEPGSMLLTGGLDHGQKGFGMALTVEALTHGLAGHGRKDRPQRWTESIFVQVLDPSFFGGGNAFTAETGFLAETIRNSRPRPGVAAVRLPGQGALAHKREAIAQGLEISQEIAGFLGIVARR